MEQKKDNGNKFELEKQNGLSSLANDINDQTKDLIQVSTDGLTKLVEQIEKSNII